MWKSAMVSSGRSTCGATAQSGCSERGPRALARGRIPRFRKNSPSKFNHLRAHFPAVVTPLVPTLLSAVFAYC
jgi:hypothetical protein